MAEGEGQAPTGFPGPFAPDAADLSRCVHCGLCLPHCPTYDVLGLETESPRGRLHIISAISEGRIEPTANAIGHLDLCLQCRNCEAVCPSGVPFGRIMEAARAEILNSGRAPLAWRLRAFLLRQLIPHRWRLDAIAAPLRFLQRTGLRRLMEGLPLLGGMLALAPTVSDRPFRSWGDIAQPQGEVRGRVALLMGCIMPFTYARVHEATVRVLARNGYRVVMPRGQTCCGALHAHNGDRRTAMALARRNIDALLAANVDAIVINSAGCGSTMKEYGELLADDPQYAEKAHRFSAMVKDVSEFLAALPFQPPTAPVDAVVTYQDSCHLAHAQRVKEAPRAILNAIPGLRLVEMPHADRCCGSAGVYSLAHRDMASQLLDDKMAEVTATGADVIATANPGCMLQLETGLRRHKLRGRVVHVIELLDEAYRRESDAL